LKRIKYNSPVVLTFALISLAVLGLNKITGGWTNAHFFSVYRSSLASLYTYPRFFLYVLGHGSWTHFISNMLLILVVGPPLEEKLGSRKLLIAIAITAFAGGIVQFVLFPGYALLGASGIVFMMIIMSSFAGSKKGTIPLTLIVVFVLYLGGELVDAVTRQDSVSQLTHIIGGICGAVMGFVMKK